MIDKQTMRFYCFWLFFISPLIKIYNQVISKSIFYRIKKFGLKEFINFMTNLKIELFQIKKYDRHKLDFIFRTYKIISKNEKKSNLLDFWFQSERIRKFGSFWALLINISYVKSTESIASAQNKLNEIASHDDHSGNNHGDIRSNQVHGVYPGEGHEALHASANFHAHEQEGGPVHELHGEFNDGHTRMQHQSMYHAGGSGHGGLHSGSGSGMAHDYAMWSKNGHFDAYNGQDHGGASIDGWLYGNGSGSAMGGVHGKGYFFGHSGGHVGSGAGMWGGGHGVATGHGNEFMGYGNAINNGVAGAAAAAAAGGAWNNGAWGSGYGAANGAGWGSAGYEGAYGGFGATSLHTGQSIAHGRDMLPGGYGAVHGGGLEHNQAIGGAGLLTASGDELAFGGTMYGSRSLGTFGAVPGQGISANVVDFYNDEGVVDPITGGFRGGYAHPGTFGYHARQNAKSFEVARNMVNGNVFRHAVAIEGPEGALADAAFGHQHIHYGQSGVLPTTVHRHSALLGALEGLTPAGDGKTASQRLKERELAENIAESRAATNDNIRTIQNVTRHNIIAGTPKSELLDRKGEEYANAARLDAIVGNWGSAEEKLKKSTLSHIEAGQRRVSDFAHHNLEMASHAAANGDLITATGFKAAAECMLSRGKQTATAYASSIGAVSHHYNTSSYVGNEEHAALAREKALVSEHMRAEALDMAMKNETSFSNAIEAEAAVQEAEGRAASEHGVVMNKRQKNQTIQSEMMGMECVKNAGIKEAIATQDNMHVITTGNQTINAQVLEILQDMALKSKSGVHSKANTAAGFVLSEFTYGELLKALETNKQIQQALVIPPIKEAMVYANAEQIAAGLINRERDRLSEARTCRNEQQEKIIKRVRNESNVLTIIETIPQDTDHISIKNGRFNFPFRSFNRAVARSLKEKKALEAQSRLRDDLRGRITKRFFESTLNVIRVENGYLNLPESVKSINIGSGVAYFNEASVIKMNSQGINHSFLDHRINTGERADMAAGMGYYVADLHGMKIDFPTPYAPNLPRLARREGKTIDLSEAVAVDIEEGTVIMERWSEYLRYIRPHVNRAVMKEFADKKLAEKTKKINEAVQKAKRIIKKDQRMLNEIANVKKRIIVNPDGKIYVEMKPAYGVVQQIRLDQARKRIPSSYITEKSVIKYGQNGIDEIIGETDRKKIENRDRPNTMILIKDAKNLADLSITHAIVDEQNKFIINRNNAFDGKVDATKNNIIIQSKQQDIGKIDWEQVERQEEEKSLDVSHGNVEDQKKREAEITKKANIYKKIKKEFHYVEGYDKKYEWEFEKRIKVVMKSNQMSIKKNFELISIIEWYMNVSFNEMRELKFEWSGSSRKQSQANFLKRFRKNGFIWMEWKNILRKDLKVNLKRKIEFELSINRSTPHGDVSLDLSFSKKISLDLEKSTSGSVRVPTQREIIDDVDKITDENLNRIRDFFMIFFTAPLRIKQIVRNNYTETRIYIETLFGNFSNIVLDMIFKNLVTIENRLSSEGGSVEIDLERIYFEKLKQRISRSSCPQMGRVCQEISQTVVSPINITVKKKTIPDADLNGFGREKIVAYAEIPLIKKIVRTLPNVYEHPQNKPAVNLKTGGYMGNNNICVCPNEAPLKKAPELNEKKIENNQIKNIQNSEKNNKENVVKIHIPLLDEYSKYRERITKDSIEKNNNFRLSSQTEIRRQESDERIKSHEQKKKRSCPRK